MLDALDITEAEIAGIGALAMHDVAMTRDFAARAQAAEDPEVALARGCQRMARSYRPALRLKVQGANAFGGEVGAACRAVREFRPTAPRRNPPPTPPPMTESDVGACFPPAHVRPHARHR